MSIQNEYSTECRFRSCDLYNVESYCESHLIKFFNWLLKKKVKLTERNFDKLWKEFEI